METEVVNKAVNVKNVPVHLWQRLKVQAAVEGITIQAALAKAIEQYVSAA